MKRTATSGGSVSIAYEDSGEGPAVLFVHAFPLDRRLWQDVISELDGFRCLALDLRGFGESGPVQGTATMSDYAADVLAVLKDAGVEQAHFVGCSLGGYVLMEVLRQKPEAVQTLALVDTRAIADTAEGREGRMKTAQQLRTGNADQRREFEEGMLLKLLGMTSLERRPPVVEQVRAMMSRASSAGIAAASEAMASRPDSTATLAQFAGRALVVVGEEDAIIPADEARQMAKSMPKGKVLVLPECGHLPPLEAPDELREWLVKLLR